MAVRRQKWSRFDAVGWVVIILAFGTAGALFSLVWDPGRISENGSALLQPVFTGVIGVLGAYVGVTKGHSDDRGRDRDRRDEPPPSQPWPPPQPQARRD